MKKYLWVALALICIHCSKESSSAGILPFGNDWKEELSTINGLNIKKILFGDANTQDKSYYIAELPKTGLSFIDATEEKLTTPFKSEFEKLNSGESSTPVHFSQKIHVLQNDKNTLSYIVEQKTEQNGQEKTQLRTSYFDLKTQKHISNDEIILPTQKALFAKKILSKTGHKVSAQNAALEKTLTETKDLITWVLFDAKGDLKLKLSPETKEFENTGEIILKPEEYYHFINESVIHNFANVSNLDIREGAIVANEVMQTQKFTKVDVDKTPCVALTFDDGPCNYTPELLDMLKKENAKATFYVLGKNSKIYPYTLIRTLQEGHELGNHSYDHKNMRTLSLDKIKFEINSTNDIVKNITGTLPKTLRPPYGAMNNAVKENANMPIILWSVDTNDWKNRNTQKIIDIASAAPPKSIILMHDIHKTTINAVPQILKNLKAKGYQFVTVSELLGGSSHMQNGMVYNHGK